MDCRCISSHAVLAITLSVITCWGFPVKETPHLRLARSGRSICPPDLSGEQCFYSQLSMYMRRHNSLTDPVALRNIGKRTFNGEESTQAAFPRGTDTEIVIDDFSPVPVESSDSPSNSVGSQSQNAAILDDIVKRLSSLSYRDQVDKTLSPKGVRNSRDVGAPLVKRSRHILCPAGMDRLACYDKALAYYFRVLRLIGDQ